MNKIYVDDRDIESQQMNSRTYCDIILLFLVILFFTIIISFFALFIISRLFI